MALEVLIDRDGKVIETKALRGEPLFLKAATEAVRKWRYRPVTIRGKPVQVEGGSPD